MLSAFSESGGHTCRSVETRKVLHMVGMGKGWCQWEGTPWNCSRAVRCWGSSWTTLNLSFFICEIGTVVGSQ